MLVNFCRWPEGSEKEGKNKVENGLSDTKQLHRGIRRI